MWNNREGSVMVEQVFDSVVLKQCIIGELSGASLGTYARKGTLIVSGAKLWVTTADGAWETVTSA